MYCVYRTVRWRRLCGPRLWRRFPVSPGPLPPVASLKLVILHCICTYMYLEPLWRQNLLDNFSFLAAKFPWKNGRWQPYFLVAGEEILGSYALSVCIYSFFSSFFPFFTTNNIFSFWKGLLTRTVCWGVLESQLIDCYTGRDERRRECFGRIRELEQTASGRTTPPSGQSLSREEVSRNLQIRGEAQRSETTGKTRRGIDDSDIVPGRGEGHRPWWLGSAMKTTTGDERTMSYSSEESLNRGRGELGDSSLSRGQVMTASFHGVSSLLHLVQQSLTGHKRRGERGTREPAVRGYHHPRPELVETMRMVLDCWTHHQNFPLPLAPSLAHFVTAKEDAYIPRRHITDVRSLWQGGPLKLGHVIVM